MTFSAAEIGAAAALKVVISDESLTVDLADGRTITAPLAWFPRLSHATADERANWRVTGGGVGIHWPDLDEDVSVEALLAGRRSGESRDSLIKWLSSRRSDRQPQEF